MICYITTRMYILYTSLYIRPISTICDRALLIHNPLFDVVYYTAVPRTM